MNFAHNRRNVIQVFLFLVMEVVSHSLCYNLLGKKEVQMSFW